MCFFYRHAQLDWRAERS